MTNSEKDDYLLNSLINKDEKGIAEIYKLIFPKVLGFVRKNNGELQDAKDVFQKALLQITARITVKEFTINSTFEGYLFTACKNLWKRALNKKKNRVTNPQVMELVNEEHDLGLATVELERWDLFREKLQELTENCRTLLGYAFQKKPYEEIALELGYNTGNVVRQRIFKCKKRLTEIIQRDKRFKKLN
ncbi:sigma-70 family RNA polymerase sigma factor [uncultured Lacinutrix sp.]|uniref:RNA polymerase sigma factor n=1 Tax=uncultured Lacinutrix sp. TaxID=574032 RepID=UPI0026230135|nr:sigma-70 family RNA polymerase sigma factor [uncultured Lacinutrix sp.]